MRAPQGWLRALVVPLTLLAFVVVPASTSAPRAPAVGMFERQCANSPTGIGDCISDGGNLGWVSGNLGQSNALYREGDFVPFRVRLTSLNPNTTYTLRINWDAVEHGLHTYDFLGTYNASENYPGPPPQLVVPCGGIGDTAGNHRCGEDPSIRTIPTDPNTTFPDGSHPPPPPAGHFSAWGATLDDAVYDPAYDTPIGVNTPGTVKRQLDLTFTTPADGYTAVVAWGGHLASVLDWGTGKTFKSGGGTGASFHMRLNSITQHPDGPTTSGNEDLSINVSAIAAPPSSFTTAVDRSSVEVGSSVLDTATLGGRPGAPVSGVVNFFVCGPSSTGPPDCTSGGAPVLPGGAVVLARSRNSRSGLVSVHFVPTAPGSYCFRAEYVPSPTALYSPAVHTNTTSECFNAVETPPQLTIVKRCFPSTDGGHFNLELDGVTELADATCGQSVGPLTVTAGTPLTVSETAGTGTVLGNYTSVVGGDCTDNGTTPPSGSITLANGDSATCTITNTRPGQLTGTLVVNKVCDPTTDGGRFDLEIDTIPFADRPCGGSTGEVTVSAGAHTVSESGGTDTSLADYTTAFSANCPGGSVDVPAGTTVTCTITNTRNPLPATLTVTKACVPGSSARFTILINGDPHGTVGCGDSLGPIDVPPGYNTVDESGADASDYNAVLGGDCQVDGTVFVGAGQHATCTITNIHKGTPLPAMLAVEKICVPSTDGGLFTLTIDGQSSANQPCGGRLGPVVVSPGPHRVAEAAGAGTSLSNYTSSIGGDCAADGSVTVAAGETKTCTITNIRAGESTAQITIVKQCSPAGVRARFQLNLDDHLFQGMRCGDSTGPVVISTGVHSVGEVATVGTSLLFRTIITGDCALNGAITLTAGQHATCTVTNVRRPLRPPLRPPVNCYRLTILRRMVRIGDLVPIVARVHVRGRPVPGVRVFAVAHRVSAVRTTGPNGRVLFLLGLHRPGILSLNIRTPFECPADPPQKIGVLGVSQPSLTG